MGIGIAEKLTKQEGIAGFGNVTHKSLF